MTSVAVVAGALASKAGNAGAAWTRLSWALGLRRLGFDVHFVEDLGETDAADAVAWFEAVTSGFGLAGRATLLRPDGTAAVGLDVAAVADVASDAALLVNISGHLQRADITARTGGRVYLDLDPGYTQLWHHDRLLDLGDHDHWYTVGALVGTDACPLPTDGVPWRPVRQPVVLDDWPVQPPDGAGPFTTVAAWRGPYGTVEHDGRALAGKVHEFRQFACLPECAPGTYELALDIHPADARDRALLEAHGWVVHDPAQIAGDPDSFRRFVQRSSAEVSVAQGAYVHTTSGWFGDRTVRYLASGRPALVQDTGFGQTMPVGDGVVPFSDIEDAVAGATAILEDHAHHAAAARQLAEQLFASDVVLGRLCEEVGIAP